MLERGPDDAQVSRVPGLRIAAIVRRHEQGDAAGVDVIERRCVPRGNKEGVHAIGIAADESVLEPREEVVDRGE